MSNREDFRQKFRELDSAVQQGKRNERMQIVTNEKDDQFQNDSYEFRRSHCWQFDRMYLLKSKEVKYAGYKVPHPLEPKLELKVQTVKDNTNQILIDTIDQIIRQVDTIQDSFLSQARQWEN